MGKSIIILHEIYGVNSHITDLKSYFESEGYVVYCPNLYQDSLTFKYDDEKQAYDYFINNVGFDKATGFIRNYITNKSKLHGSVYIVGFSIGATIAWRCSSDINNVKGIVGFYGSRIRNYLALNPKCDVLLFFSEKENSFNTKDVIRVLNKKKNTRTHLLNEDHGFADRYSSKYSLEAQEYCFNEMMKFFNSGVVD
ncbi:dienelactone hydrolase family protein [Alkalihalobacillus sp. 1P02AB]|uniref:dienelactone hydrolase family protein n=1 Tax=Alkalihalobacillus sp. 1P02AB TaxID=3132260 RepID=UPI0039A602A3